MKLGSLIRDKASGLMKGSLKSEVSKIDRSDRSKIDRSDRKAKVDHNEHKKKEVVVGTDFPPSPERNSPTSSKYTLMPV